ncbi:MAG TPA: deoxynucleoside kinase [Bacteroidetes bacterium]|nr:deoxynucleoside kinase [Bacteroidota bacterium]
MKKKIKYNYIVIEGNIGAGKTSLATMIARDYGARLILEQFEDNPFLAKFYVQPERYAFPLEMSFLTERYNQLKHELAHPELFTSFTIADYYFSKSLIFAQNNLNRDEYNLFQQIFSIIYDTLPRPDLYVYLHVSIERLLKNIAQRGRDYEKNIHTEYLEKIQNGYFRFMRQEKYIPFLVLDINNIDFVKNRGDYKKLTHIIFSGDYTPGITRTRKLT